MTPLARRLEALERQGNPAGPLVLFPGDSEALAAEAERNGRTVLVIWPVRPPRIERPDDD